MDMLHDIQLQTVLGLVGVLTLGYIKGPVHDDARSVNVV